MQKLVEAEWYKLRKNGVFQSLCCFMVIAVILYSLVTYFSHLQDEGYRIDITGIKLYANALLMNQLFLKLFLGILAGFFISSEYASGVLRRALTAGIGRSRLYATKLGMYSLGTVILSLLVPVLAVLTGGLLTWFGLLSGFGELPDSSPTEYILRTLGFTALFAAAFASIAAWMAVLLADSGKTIGVAIIFFLFIDQVLQVLAARFSFFKSVYDYSLFKLFMTTMSYGMKSSEMLLSILMPIAAIAVFALLGIRVFRNKEIQ